MVAASTPLQTEPYFIRRIPFPYPAPCNQGRSLLLRLSSGWNGSSSDRPLIDFAANDGGYGSVGDAELLG